MNFQRKPTPNEKLIRHKIFDRFLSYLENEKVKYKGQIMPYILHPLTVKGLLELGWTQDEIEETEASIIQYANCEVLQDAPKNLFRELKKLGREDLIFENRVVGVPGKITNALICGELAKCFPEVELRLYGIFVKIRDFDIDEQPCEVWRIDVDEQLSRQGFFVPIIENNLISGLRVFRYPNDERPFILRARFDLIDYTRGHYE